MIKKNFDNEDDPVVLVKRDIAKTNKGGTTISVAEYENKECILKAILRKAVDNLDHLFNEREVLKLLDHPGTVKLIRTLKDSLTLYLLIDIAYGASLDKILKACKFVSEPFTKLLISQLVLIMDYLHSSGIVYRDLKASNLVVDTKGHLKLIDYGLAKFINKERTSTICGTLHSMAPEMLEEKEYGYEVDFYGFGILFYELLIGMPPFGYETGNANIKEDIKRGISPTQLDTFSDRPKLKSVLTELLQNKPDLRIGTNDGWKEVKNHSYFSDVDWGLIEAFMFSPTEELEEKINLIYGVKEYYDDIDVMGENLKDELDFENQENLEKMDGLFEDF